MFVRDNLQKLKMFSDEGYPNTKFLIMFVGAAICSYFLLAIAGFNTGTEWQSAQVVSLLIAFLFVTSLVWGSIMFKHKSNIVKRLPVKSNSN